MTDSRMELFYELGAVRDFVLMHPGPEASSAALVLEKAQAALKEMAGCCAAQDPGEPECFCAKKFGVYK